MTQKKSSQESVRTFRFPLYLYENPSDFVVENEFTEEEKELYCAQKLYLTGDFPKVFSMLDKLRVTAKDPGVKVGALYYQAVSGLQLCKFAEFSNLLHEMTHLLEEDIPYKKELLLVLRDLESYQNGNAFYTVEFVVDTEYTYHPSCMNYLFLMAAYSAAMRSITFGTITDPTPYELACQGLELSKNTYMEMTLHMYLAGLYKFQTKDASRDVQQHLYRALALAEEHRYVNKISLYYSYLAADFDLVLKQFPPVFGKQIRSRNQEHQDIFKSFLQYTKKSFLYSALKPKEFEYIEYAIKGLSNKEIAAKKNLSLTSISKKYTAIFLKTNTHTKKELAEAFESVLNYAMIKDE